MTSEVVKRFMDMTACGTPPPSGSNVWVSGVNQLGAESARTASSSPEQVSSAT
jgi:hypothetical protein